MQTIETDLPENARHVLNAIALLSTHVAITDTLWMPEEIYGGTLVELLAGMADNLGATDSDIELAAGGVMFVPSLLRSALNKKHEPT